MSDPFDSSRHTLSRAKHHIRDLEEKFRAFCDERPYKRVFRPDPQGKHIVITVVLTKKLPETFDSIAFDAVSNLRAALDQATYAAAFASGVLNPKSTAFPFAGGPADFENALKGRCADIPHQIHALFRRFQPYKGGDDFFCALNGISNIEKHAILIPVGMGAIRTRGDFQGAGIIEVPHNPVWDSAKNEIVVATVGAGSKGEADFQYDVDFGLLIAFSEVPAFRDQDAVAVLDKLAAIVESILLGVEAETRRLGFIK